MPSELLTPVTGTRSDPVRSAALRTASRASGQLWAEVHDTECEHCDRVFPIDPEFPNQWVCRRCRRKEVRNVH